MIRWLVFVYFAATLLLGMRPFSKSAYRWCKGTHLGAYNMFCASVESRLTTTLTDGETSVLVDTDRYFWMNPLINTTHSDVDSIVLERFATFLASRSEMRRLIPDKEASWRVEVLLRTAATMLPKSKCVPKPPFPQVAMQRTDKLIREDAQMSRRQLVVIRVVWGLFALQAAGTLAEQFAHARSGEFFNLPLFDWWPLMPALLHRTILYSSYLFAGMLLAGIRPSVGAWGMAAVLFYVLVSDHFAFRHVWVLLANVYLWLGVVLVEQTDITIDNKSSKTTLRQYALFAVRGFIALAYFIAALPKMNSDFLSGHVIHFLASENWGSDSVIVNILESHPLICPLLATLSCVIEIYLAVALLIPRLRWTAFAIGMGFHLAVPLVAWVGHSLNLYFVASYLFFCWPAQSRPRATCTEQRWQLIERVDRLQRIDWERSTTDPSINKLLRLAATQTLYFNPLVLCYVPAWSLLIAAKTMNNFAYAPACLAGFLIAIHELRWLFAGPVSAQPPDSKDGEQQS